MPKFIPRQRKHKNRQKNNNRSQNGDTNAIEILPKVPDEQAERRRQIAEELKSQQNYKAGSAKKQKRLNKYIDTKLKREENQALISKLSQTKIDTSLLRSTKHLGKVRESKREILGRALRENRAGIDTVANEKLLLEKVGPGRTEADVETYGSVSGDDSDVSSIRDNREKELANEYRSIQVGSGLKRPLERDEHGQPIIKKRKRLQERNAREVIINGSEESEWEGFSSDSSDHDSQNGLHTVESSSIVPVEACSESLDMASQHMSPPQGDTQLKASISDNTSEDHESGSDEGSEISQDWEHQKKKRVSAFTAWATERRNEAIGFVPSAPVTDNPPSLPIQAHEKSFVPRPLENDPSPSDIGQGKIANNARKSYSVPVTRSAAVEEARLAMSVVAEEQKIMEAVHNNDIVIIGGATGSGKTTQVPQFLYEAGYGSRDGPTPGTIGVTQPRRVAAVSMAERVGEEMGSAKSKISYQIRFESSTTSDTAIKFMTDGILLREISQNFTLDSYSAIIIDEVHERSINTDVLIGMMTRIVELRTKIASKNPKVKPLKLIIMSATLDQHELVHNERLFKNGEPPAINVEGRQYPIRIHFARRTERDYLEETFKKVSKGHKKLPPGGMLVFLTGQNEIMSLCKRLRKSFPSAQESSIQQAKVRIAADELPLEDEDFNLDEKGAEEAQDSDSDSEVIRVDEDQDDDDFDIGESSDKVTSVHVLPLYSQLPIAQQLRVFEEPPAGSRLIVVATNVAETSVTIPGIRYVFDCGRVKQRNYNGPAGIQTYELGWISKASASQRAGRAGRTGPGHCYRLYSSAVFERDFAKYSVPEILRTPVEGVVLTLKGMGLTNVINFPFPTSPDRDALVRAEQLLMDLGALDPNTKVITPVGREMAAFPVSPRFARMLLIGRVQGCLDYVIALVAALASSELIIPECQIGILASDHVGDEIDKEDMEKRQKAEDEKDDVRKAYNKAQAALTVHSRTNDALKLLTAVCAAAYASDMNEFARGHFIRLKALSEANQLREQLSRLAGPIGSDSVPKQPLDGKRYNPKLPMPSMTTIQILPQIAAAGFIDCVVQRVDFTEIQLPGRKPRSATHVPYICLLQDGDDHSEVERKLVYIHPSSLLARLSVKSLPRYVVYTHLSRASNSASFEEINGGSDVEELPEARVRMHPLTPISQRQLLALADGTSLLGRWRAGGYAGF